MHDKVTAGFMSGLGEGKKAKELPSHVQKLESGGYACAHCGGMVGEDGEAPMEPAQEEDLEEQQRRARLGHED